MMAATVSTSKVTLKDRVDRFFGRVGAEPFSLPQGVKPRSAAEMDAVLGDPSNGRAGAGPAAVPVSNKAPAGTLWYEVKPGDTLTSLAVKYNMSTASLTRLNRLIHADLFPGQRILVKDPAAPGSAVPSPEPARSLSPCPTGTVVSPQSPFQVVSRDTQKAPFTEPTTRPVREYVSQDGTAFRVKVLYMTAGKGPIDGYLEATDEFVRFWPEKSKIVSEFGEQELTLEFEHEDLLAPTTQCAPPSLRKMPSPGDGVAGHRIEKPATMVDDKKMPVFLQLRLRLVYGIAPTPQTLAQYWFAVMPQWIDAVYDLLRKHARVCEVEPWEAMARDEAPPDSLPASSLLNLSDIIEVNLLGKSELLDPFLASALAKELPLRLQYSDWICMYSSYEHGMSLSNMYRKLRDDVSEPCLMIIRDANRSVFGCYATESWRPESCSYGGGECMVFKVTPELKVYRWTSEKQGKPIFMMSTEDYVMMGGGHTASVDATGAAAIYFDSELLQGASNCSHTFSNDCLASSNDFKIDGLEVWQFVSTE